MVEYAYGFADVTIEEVRHEIEKLLGIQFEPRHSYDRCGDYYVFRDRATEVEAFLQENCEEDPGEWTENEHRELGTLLYFVAREDEVTRMHEILMRSLKSARFLRSSKLNIEK